MFIIRYKNFFLGLSALITFAGIASIAFFGLHFGIDFTGGSLLEVESTTPFANLETLKIDLATVINDAVLVQPTESNGVIVRARTLSPEEHVKVLEVISKNNDGTITEKRFDSIGPVIGTELRHKSYWAIALVIFLIVLYITFAFRKVSRPVSSWKYGGIAIITLLHDVIVPTGFFAIWGYLTGAEVDLLFISAILAILGFSIHDTIVVFDRIRENLTRVVGGESFGETVGKSLSQTFTRSINTSLTVVLTLVALVLLGGESTKNFVITLMVGIIAGTYSSVFFASPLLVLIERFQKKA